MECALIINHLIFFNQLYMNQTVINHNVMYTVTYFLAERCSIYYRAASCGLQQSEQTGLSVS